MGTPRVSSAPPSNGVILAPGLALCTNCCGTESHTLQQWTSSWVQALKAGWHCEYQSFTTYKEEENLKLGSNLDRKHDSPRRRHCRPHPPARCCISPVRPNHLPLSELCMLGEAWHCTQPFQFLPPHCAYLESRRRQGNAPSQSARTGSLDLVAWNRAVFESVHEAASPEDTFMIAPSCCRRKCFIESPATLHLQMPSSSFVACYATRVQHVEFSPVAPTSWC